MAVGTVSGIDQEEWQLIDSQALSGLTTKTVSSISGYKKLRIVWKSITTNSSANSYIRFNGNSTAGNYSGNAWWHPGGSSSYTNTEIPVETYNYTAQYARSGYVEVSDANKAIAHTVDGTGFDAYIIKGLFMDGNAITSVTFSSNTSTFTAGTLYVYGIAA